MIFCVSERSANDWLPDQEEILFIYSLDLCGKVLAAGGTAGGGLCKKSREAAPC